jgi:hypothetical protein
VPPWKEASAYKKIRTAVNAFFGFSEISKEFRNMGHAPLHEVGPFVMP